MFRCLNDFLAFIETKNHFRRIKCYGSLLHVPCCMLYTHFTTPWQKNQDMLSSIVKLERASFYFCVCCPVDSWGLLSFVLSIGCFFVQTWVGWFRLRSSSTLLLPRRIRLLGLVYRTINANFTLASEKTFSFMRRFFAAKLSWPKNWKF